MTAQALGLVAALAPFPTILVIWIWSEFLPEPPP